MVHADRGPLRAQDDCYSGILDNDVSRDSLLGDEFECAVLEVFVGDAVVVQECDVRVGSPDFVHKREGQCGERQHAEPAGMGAAPNAAKRRVDPEAGGPCRLAGNESEGSFGHPKQG